MTREEPRWAGSERRLVEAIRDEILAQPERRITFARFMERALTEPGLGYYAVSDLRPTRRGDFLTAPELHPLFGRSLGRFIEGVWHGSSSGSGTAPLRVLEYGAGRGTLRRDATDGLGFDVDWIAADLPGRGDAVAGPADLVLANEYLDALPVHRLVRTDRLLEAWVGWEDDWFTEVLAGPSTPALAALLADEGVELREGQRAEVSLAAPRWFMDVDGRLAAGGVVLVIDYGHEAAQLYGPERMAGSLLTYRGHEVADDPFSAIGHSDITAHVDVTALERAAGGVGLSLVGATTQGPFLTRLGLGEMLAELGRRPGIDPADYLAARAAVGRLLDPRQLGGFRVLAWARPGPGGQVPALPGFAHDRAAQP